MAAFRDDEPLTAGVDADWDDADIIQTRISPPSE